MNYFLTASEYLRPWRILTLVMGIGFLFVGALWSGLPDWDIPVSIIMAIPAYLTAAPSLRVLIERRWHQLPIAAFFTWLTVDGTYFIYWSLRDPATLEALRHANAAASSCLYLMCGLVWYAKGQPIQRKYPAEDDPCCVDDESQYH